MSDKKPPRHIDPDTGAVIDTPDEPDAFEKAQAVVRGTDNTDTAGIVRADEVAQTSPQLTRYLSASSAAITEDPEQVAFEIVQRILDAETVDDVLGRSKVLSADDVLGHPVQIERVRWQRSAFDGREAMYALVNAKRVDSGEDIVLTCGGRNVMAQLWRLGELNAYPIAVRFAKAPTPTAAGFYPLWLEPSV